MKKILKVKKMDSQFLVVLKKKMFEYQLENNRLKNQIQNLTNKI